MSLTTKPFSDFDATQVMQKSYNENATLGVDGWVVGLVGRKITLTAHSATQDDFEFLEGSTSLYIIRVTYTDSTHATLASVERIS